MNRSTPVTDSMVSDYLSITSSGRRLTVGSYLHETLRGSASDYSSQYQDRMVRTLRAMRDAGEIVQVPSMRGGISYVLRCGECGGTRAPYPAAAAPCTCTRRI